MQAQAAAGVEGRALGLELRATVRRPRCGERRLVALPFAVLAHGLHAREQHEALHARVRRGREHSGGTVDIHVLVGRVVLRACAEGVDLRGKVEDGLASRSGRRHGAAIAYVATHPSDTACRE